MFYKKAVSKNFAMLTTQLLKETPTQVFSREYCKIFMNANFEKHLRRAASETLPINTKLFIKILLCKNRLLERF